MSGIAFVFPGQGSQTVGMLAESAAAHPIVGRTFEEAAEALGYDLWAVIQGGPQERLNLTETTQPALLACSVALWRAWREAGGPPPEVMAGHSLGEISALTCAGAIPFPDALQLVRQRGAFMQSAVPAGEGAMAAVIGLEDADVNRVCETAAATAGEPVAAVNYNSPGQVVIAGRAAAVTAAGEACKEAGAKRVMPLPVSAPFHTELMQPAAEQLRQVLAEIPLSAPEIPVIHNVHAAPEAAPARIRDLLAEQVHAPVRWSDCVRTMQQRGATRQVECGPGKVLSGLARRIDRAIECFTLEAPEDMAATLAALSPKESSGGSP